MGFLFKRRITLFVLLTLVDTVISPTIIKSKEKYGGVS